MLSSIVRVFTLGVVMSAWGLPSSGSAQPYRPELFYDERADERCAASSGYQIKPEWVAELRARLPEIRSLWDTTAPPMLEAVARIAGKPLGNDLPPVRLTLCDSPSQSFIDVSVNMRFALRSFTAQPVPMRYKADTAFHELLHGFVGRHVPKESPLLQAHRAESACVRNHLHLLALQKAVLLSLGAQAQLEQIVTIDGQLPSGCYKRAWAIVDAAADAWRPYVHELAEGT